MCETTRDTVPPGLVTNVLCQQKLAKMLVRNGSLKALDLSYNPVGPEGLRRLSVFLISNSRLETLALRGCGVQPHGVKSGIYALARYDVNNKVQETQGGNLYIYTWYRYIFAIRWAVCDVADEQRTL